MPAPDGEEYFVMSLYFRRGPLGRRNRHIQLSRRGRPVVDRPAAPPVDHRATVRRDIDDGRGALRSGPKNGPVHAGCEQAGITPILPISCPRFMNCGRNGVRPKTGRSGRSRRRPAAISSRAPPIPPPVWRRITPISTARLGPCRGTFTAAISIRRVADGDELVGGLVLVGERCREKDIE
jgi:hypothetical protein